MRNSRMCQIEVLEAHEGNEAQMQFKEIMAENFTAE